jgi:uncharacterized 2Fe-2S/4Fe-4S cluster protein (DUF4445 family)
MKVGFHTPHGVEWWTARPGQTWLEVLFEAGWSQGQAVCAGTGFCGACRVQFVEGGPAPRPEDLRRLGEDAVARGWRLACRHAPTPGAVVQVVGGERSWEVVPTPQAVRLAVDVGTTAIKWAYAAPDVGPFACPNPQLPVGADVLSRVRYALSHPEGPARLRSSVVDMVRHWVQAGVGELVVAGNVVMLALLLGRSTASLAAAPYRMPRFGGWLCLEQDLPPAYIPPPLGPFVGSDVTAGLIACVAANLPLPFILVDLGTNGEIAWYDGQRLVVTSVPMGPAVEGVGLRWGRPAGPGIITALEVGPAGVRALGQGPWQGISGTGYVSLLAALRRLGVISARGHFVADPPSPLGRRLARCVVETSEGRFFPVAGPVGMLERDVEEVLKVKAALGVALESVLRLVSQKVACVAVAGAWGSHVSVEDLMTLGFFPASWGPRLRIVGNTSLQGALLLGQDPKWRQEAEDLPSRVQVVETVRDPDFASRYMAAMHLAGWGNG